MVVLFYVDKHEVGYTLGSKTKQTITLSDPVGRDQDSGCKEFTQWYRSKVVTKWSVANLASLAKSCRF